PHWRFAPTGRVRSLRWPLQTAQKYNEGVPARKCDTSCFEFGRCFAPLCGVNLVLFLKQHRVFMPQHKSAEKRVRQDARRRMQNRFKKVALRKAIKAVRTAETKEELLERSREAQVLLDRMATKGIIHPNYAANRKRQFA